MGYLGNVKSIHGDSLVRASTNVNGEISLSAGGKLYKQRQSILAPIGDMGYCVLSPSVNACRGMARAMDFDIGAVKARFYNGSLTQQDGCYASVAVVNADDPYGISAAWTILTVNGSQSFTTPSGTGTIPEHTFGIVDSDMAFIQGSAGQLLLIRYFTPTANSTRFQHPTRFTPTINADGTFFYYQIGNGVLNPNGFTKNNIGSGPAMGLFVYPTNPLRSFVFSGGSTVSGQGDSVTLGWVRRFEKLAELSGKPISTMNLGHPSSTNDASIVRLLQALSDFRPTFAGYMPFSPNGNPVMTDAPKMKAQALQFIEACANVGTIPILITFQPPRTQGAGTQACCQAVNDYTRELGANGACIVIDFQLLFGGSTTALTWADSNDTSDNTHPSAQGHGKAASLFMSELF